MFGPYIGGDLVLPSAKSPYSGPSEAELVPAPDTSGWYQTQWGCLRGVDPTAIARRHTFPDAVLPRGQPDDPAAPSRICLEYRTAWAQETANAGAMVDAERAHPTFAFNGGGPGTVTQIDQESQLRRLDQPLTKCQAVLAADAPLYRNTVAPPPPVGVPREVQNASNPIAAIMRPGGDPCRAAADQVATAMSGRTFHNPTRQDTMRFDLPFAPPGIGKGAPRPPVGSPYYS